MDCIDRHSTSLGVLYIDGASYALHDGSAGAARVGRDDFRRAGQVEAAGQLGSVKDEFVGRVTVMNQSSVPPPASSFSSARLVHRSALEQRLCSVPRAPLPRSCRQNAELAPLEWAPAHSGLSRLWLVVHLDVLLVH